MKCKTHPTYQAKREPRSSCLHCWLMWINTRLDQIEIKVDYEIELRLRREEKNWL